ncbi:MAG: hypothetical protein KC444_09290 [Nitrosopumilus sp.]|nr:hypothetical protein [Nitrosopumilus sp.]
MSFHSFSPWENNPSFDECVFRLHGVERLKFSQLEKIKKLFKPHEILVHLNPRDEPIEAEFVSLLFKTENPPSKSMMKVISALKATTIATDGLDWTE